MHRCRTAVAAAAAAAVLPLLGLAGTPVQAASGATWNLLADCESGQVWDINTGNGYYGGLQFSAGTWNAYGGQDYARRADLATRVQQIRTAERLLDDRAWAPWPACSRRLGLTQADADEPFTPGHGAGGGAHETYVTQRGDTLASIARAKDVAGGWQAIYDLNRKRIGPDPNHLAVGLRLRLP